VHNQARGSPGAGSVVFDASQAGQGESGADAAGGCGDFSRQVVQFKPATDYCTVRGA
jgi:hypothetical protein